MAKWKEISAEEAEALSFVGVIVQFDAQNCDEAFVNLPVGHKCTLIAVENARFRVEVDE